MTPSDDPSDDMFRSHRDDEDADRLLDGEVAPDDAPPGLSTVAALVQRAGADADPADPAELAGEASIVAAMAAVLADVGGVPQTRRPSMIQGVVRAKVAAAIVVAAVGVGAAAAAVSVVTGPGRPDRQGEMEAGAATTSTAPGSSTTIVEVTVPTTAPTTATTIASTSTVPPTSGSAPSTGEPGKAVADAEIFGLCTALHGTDDKLGPPALAKIEAAAAQTGRSLKDFCERAIADKKGDKNDGDDREDDEGDEAEGHSRPDDPGEHGRRGAPGQDGDQGEKGGHGGQGNGHGNSGKDG